MRHHQPQRSAVLGVDVVAAALDLDARSAKRVVSPSTQAGAPEKLTITLDALKAPRSDTVLSFPRPQQED